MSILSNGPAACNHLLDAALKYARSGWRVFPLHTPTPSGCSCSKADCKSVGKHPRTKNGLKEASADESLIRKWWGKWPTANIGIVTGAESGLLVIDVDGDFELPEVLQNLPRTIQAKTSRGKHVYLKYPADSEIGNRAKIGGLPIDVRGSGGYVVAPGSLHQSGATYSWLNSPDDDPLADAPVNLLQWIYASKASAAAAKNNGSACKRRASNRPALEQRVIEYLKKPPPAIQGQNGSGQLMAVVRCIVDGFNLDRETAFHLLMTHYNPTCKPPWSDKELYHKIDDVLKTPGDKPKGYLLNTEPGRIGTLGSDGKSEADEDDRRIVVITTKEMEVNTEAAVALAEHDAELFQRCGALVRITEDGDENGDIKRPAIPRIDIIGKETLREKLAAAVAFEKVKTMPDGQIITTPAHPPAWSVAAIHARGHWPKVKRLHAVVNHPILKPDGTISNADYDRTTGILGKWSLPINVPLRPTAADVRSAIKVLDDAIVDFEFVDASHRASWYAALLTPLARFAFEGAVPIFLVDANTRGAGKGLLLDCIALTTTGENFAVMPYSSEDEEMRKKITSILLTGERLVLFDNLTGRFGCSALDALVTAPGRWSDRLLGGNKTVSLPIVATFYATGNNVITQGDLIRRITHIRLETASEKPEQKTGFRFPNLRAHVKANRPVLLSAALTILRAFADAGRPAQKLEPWGSFEAWSEHVRAPIVWAGMPDPAKARDLFQAEADSEADDLGSLLTAWATADPHGDGMTAAAAVEKAKSTNEGDLKSAIENIIGNLDARKLGNRLRRIKRRVIGGWFFQKVGEVQRAVKWAVRTADRFKK